MGGIFQKAQQEQARPTSVYQEIRDILDGLPADAPNWRDMLESAIEDMIRQEAQTDRQEPWDFSRERSRAVFARGGGLVLRPVTNADKAFYLDVRMQYSGGFAAACHMTEEEVRRLFWREVSFPEAFYCIIEGEKDHGLIGYLGIKDTRKETWEVAVELDEAHTGRGFGSRSVVLFLDEVCRVTGRTQFRAVVEVDNLPSQKCFEKIGAELIGLCDNAVLKTDGEKQRFEEQNLGLITEDMVRLAKRLGVAPRKLLSHLLDYRYRVKEGCGPER